MKIEEAVKRIEQMGEYERFIDEPISKVSVLNTIRQINQPKPEVPKFVADWLEFCKNNEISLYDAMTDGNDELDKWFAVDELNRQELFAEAWLAYPNIAVEKEKLYTVEIPNPNEGQLSFVLMREPGGNVRIKIMHSSNLKLLETDSDLQLTEQEIRKDFEWAWQFAEEVTK
ncbi:DUF1642 domain-containing protein [Streptococcus uberis]